MVNPVESRQMQANDSYPAKNKVTFVPCSKTGITALNYPKSANSA